MRRKGKRGKKKRGYWAGGDGREGKGGIDRLGGSETGSHKGRLSGAIGGMAEREAVSTSESAVDGPDSDSSKDKLLVRGSGVVKVIPFDDIDWVDAAGDYMCVHALGETHIIRITLGELMQKLDDKLFVRIHRSTIVNVKRVASITPLPKGGSLLELTGGETLKVSRNYRESIRNLFS